MRKIMLILAMVMSFCTARAQLAGIDIMNSDSIVVIKYLESRGWKFKKSSQNMIDMVNPISMSITFKNNRCMFIFGLSGQYDSNGLEMLILGNWRMISCDRLVKMDDSIVYKYSDNNYVVYRNNNKFFKDND